MVHITGATCAPCSASHSRIPETDPCSHTSCISDCQDTMQLYALKGGSVLVSSRTKLVSKLYSYTVHQRYPNHGNIC